MCDLFRVHHPTKLAEADSIMLKYKDREDDLVDALCSKYDVDEHGDHVNDVDEDDVDLRDDGAPANQLYEDGARPSNQ
jgi:hypothetical protein